MWNQGTVVKIFVGGMNSFKIFEMAFINLAFRAVVLTLEQTSGPPESVVKHGLLGPITKVSHTIGQGWSQRICTYNKFSSDTGASSLDTTLRITDPAGML